MLEGNNTQKGVTLIELIFVIAIFIVITSIAVSGGMNTKHRLAVRTLSDEIQKTLNMARIYATTNGVRVTFCPVDDVVNLTADTQCSSWGDFATTGSADGKKGWIVFKDDNKDSQLGSMTNLIDKLLFDDGNGQSVIDKVTFPKRDGVRVVRFTRKGHASAGAGSIRIRSLRFSYQRKIVVSTTGRIRNDETTP